MRLIVTVFFVISIALVGCTSGLYSVYSRENAVTKPLDGIPFYLKKARCKQENTYLEPLYSVSLISEAREGTGWKEVGRKNILLNQEGYESARQKNLLDPTGELEKSFSQLCNGNSPINLATQSLIANGNLILIGDTASWEPYIDYGDTYLINTKRSLAGSSHAVVKLSADGTLSEAEATVEDSSFTTLAGMLPITAYLTNALDLVEEPTMSTTDVGSRPLTKLRLLIEPVVYVHTLTKYLYPTQSRQCIRERLQYSAGDVNYTRQEYKRQPETAAKNAISFQGSVTLPTTPPTTPGTAGKEPTKLPGNNNGIIRPVDR
ncbi:MAG TPA: hypothetical protein PK014_14455 [Thermoanaerobaculia bacterium]|nr:hypothetical protein [Thermoanaerobaculia bacterium]HUM31241.1 hypothetical protein [Thermoanaerobaculia bacterium]HXK69601.1 hypothetical protein [Thermoanaerobaculia bacterium]